MPWDIIAYVALGTVVLLAVIWLFNRVTPRRSKVYNFSSNYGSSLWTVIIIVIIVFGIIIFLL